jgi:hypothetical protein
MTKSFEERVRVPICSVCTSFMETCPEPCPDCKYAIKSILALVREEVSEERIKHYLDEEAIRNNGEKAEGIHEYSKFCSCGRCHISVIIKQSLAEHFTCHDNARKEWDRR